MRSKIFGLLIHFIFLNIHFGALAQNKSEKVISSKDRSLIYQSVLKNFTLYQCSVFLQNQENFIETSNLSSVIENVNFILDTSDYYGLHFKIRSEFPEQNGYIFVEFGGFNSIFRRQYGTIKDQFKTDVLLENDFSMNPEEYKGILAFNKETKLVVFVCGNLFLDNLKGVFEFDLSSKDGLRKYIELRYFNYIPKQIRFDKKRTFFYSEVTKGMYTIRLKELKNSKLNYVKPHRSRKS